MGLAMCTLCTPFSGLIGCITEGVYRCEGSCCHQPQCSCFDSCSPARRIHYYVASFLIGMILYIIVTFRCSSASGEPWELWYGYEKGGGCWSTGGDFNSVYLGIMAALFLGFGLTGSIVWLIAFGIKRCRVKANYDAIDQSANLIGDVAKENPV